MSSSAETSSPAHSGRTLLASVWWMTGSNLLAQTFTYGSLILLARWLDPSSFGSVALALAMVGIGILFVDQGTWGAVIVERHLSRAYLAKAFRRCMVTAVALAILMASMSDLLVERFAAGGHPGAVAAVALCLPLHGMAVVPTALLQRSMQFRRLAGINAIANIASALTAVVLALEGAGVWSLVARQLVLYGLVGTLCAALCLPALRAHASTAALPSAPRTGRRTEWWFFLFTIAYTVTGSLDKFVIGLFGNAALVGMYSIANTIAWAPWTQFSAQAGQVLFAAAASQPDQCSHRTEQSAKLMSLLMLPLLPVGILTAPVLLPSALGPEWAPVVPAFQVLLVVGIGNAIVNCLAEPLTGMGFMPFRARIMVAQCLATLVALVVLVPIGGMLGAALAELLVFLPYAAVYLTAGARRAETSARALWSGIRPAFAMMLAQIFVSAVCALALIWLGLPHAVVACSAAVAGLSVAVPLMVRAVAGMRAS